MTLCRLVRCSRRLEGGSVTFRPNVQRHIPEDLNPATKDKKIIWETVRNSVRKLMPAVWTSKESLFVS
jgi:hypothetical protein